MSTDRLFNKSQGDSLLSILAQIRDGYNSVDNVPSLSSENPLQNKIVTGAITDIIETLGGTAQRSYAIGQYFLANDGYYYVATSAITASSSTISTGVGGNCSKTSIAAGMNDLVSQISNLLSDVSDLTEKASTTVTISIGGVSTDVYVWRIGPVVTLVFNVGTGTAFANVTDGKTLGTLPEGYRPLFQTLYFPIMVRDNGSWDSANYNMLNTISISTTGVISYRGNPTNINGKKYISTTVTFITYVL